MLKKNIFYLLVIFASIFIISGCTKNSTTTNSVADSTNTSTNENSVSATNTSTNNTVASDPEGTIVVEAGDGTLTGAEPSTSDYIMESARGLEAYLGTKGATANYTVPASISGTYKLHVKVSDDGFWDSGFRDATIAVNGVQVVTYQHISEDTKGWKWYAVGNISLKEGDNTIAFTKANDMPAAFVMDEFKLVPVILN